MSCRLRFLFLCFSLTIAVNAPFAGAQESSSRETPAVPVANPAPAAVSGPAAALRDTLAAACAHDQGSFAKFLTARNAESFHNLTDAARVELMKRFVLLADAGKPAITSNPAGRPIVSCATPYGTAELQIGGTDLRDNVAFLPLDLREASDPDSSKASHILMSMVRENNQWKVLSIGLLFLDLPSLAVEWDQAESHTNEQAALDTISTLVKSIEAYRRSYLRIPSSLAQLGPPAKGAPSADAAGLIDASLADGLYNGYVFRYVIVGADDLGAPAKYEIAATPRPYGRAGKLSFFRDSSGTLHAADHAGAVGTQKDPELKPN